MKETSAIRILHVVTIMNLGGIETFLMTLYRNIDRSKVQFDFLVHRKEEGFFDKEIKALGGNIIPIQSLNPFKYSSYKKELALILNRYSYKIIHSHLNANSSLVLDVAMKSNVLIRISHSHIDKSGSGIKGLIKSYLKRKINKVATHRFACSVQAGRWLFGIENNFIVFNNAIKSDNFVYNNEVREGIRRELAIKDGTILVGNIARFNFQKNHKFMIDVFYEFHKKEPNSCLLLLGDGELLTDINEKVKKLGLKDKVIFTGAVANANEYLNAMDIFLFPSLFEGLGIVAVEAQCCGLPVIMTDSLPNEVEITQLVQRVSLELPAKDWADIMCRFLANKLSRDNWQYKIKEAHYDVDENVRFLESFYASVIL
ncbi:MULTISPECIES: glycosyltransferase family 1 protein [unclassified Myroides]|uniref:glycosyltransferase family 1 protein n=1 Tax=unclassified Myroides TaxID=2642485 RepID=UPI003100C797